MRNTIFLSLLFLFSMGCAQSKSKPITEFSQNDTKTGILVDVRTPEEYATGHIDNALNINWYDSDFAKQLESISKDETIYVYCKKGGRSAKAAHLLDSLGYKNVIDLEGGYDAYRNR
ncbi:rhodanese-like domain-containing protein [Maribacter algarum]|uniref:Rhodanese-like domain-containing protein n=1 Tax=Maribacter algarum (ex Zhang et al. 2020) TaxID=2578118 RepID=A0A5S3PT43_9FLAO|nr:rhodanese-like domain-containing protein [Maribacter algarum]TMM58161.1 rhodanese-like domain-containing protein [Maribacter algarum]